MPVVNEALVSGEGSGGSAAAAIDLGSAYEGRDSDAMAATHWVPVVVESVRPDVAWAERRARAAALLNAAGKRALDIAVAATVLLLTLPVIALVSLLVVLDSRGPVFYRAWRVGRHGRPLRMLKFRKMHDEAHGRPLTMAEDERFTRIGRILATTKIDELPQLWHVLRGEMSLIGPRPEDPAFVAERAEDYEHILAVRPGVTGLSQIAFAEESAILCKVDPVTHYRSRIFPQKIKLDRMYAARPTLAMDLRILFRTCAAVLLRREVAVHRESGRMNLRRR
jgi:lipopolysaccharide/colanic/teichoic acid biosynthesis glycosyltransferase